MFWVGVIVVLLVGLCFAGGTLEHMTSAIFVLVEICLRGTKSYRPSFIFLINQVLFGKRCVPGFLSTLSLEATTYMFSQAQQDEA